MDTSRQQRPLNHLIWPMALLLWACGGGSGNDTTTTVRGPESGSIAGVAFDAAIYNGDIEVRDFSNAEAGPILLTEQTNGSGYFAGSIRAESGPILVQVAAGNYMEDASLVQVSLSQEHRLLAVDFYEAGSSVDLAVTFFTTLATGLTEYLVQDQGLSAEVAIERAYAEIDAWAGFDTRRTTPLLVGDVANTSPFLTDGLRAGFVAAAISKLTRVVAEDMGESVHQDYTSIAFLALAYDDIRADGALDGEGQGGSLSFGDLTITRDTYRSLLATRLLQFADTSYNQTGLGFDELLDYGSQINLYAGELFGYIATAQDIRDYEPSVSQFLPGEGEVVSGSFNAFALVYDEFGLSSVQYFMDGQFAATAGNPNLPFRLIDTLNYSNGVHAFRIEVTNWLGNTSSLTHTINIQN